LIPIKSRNTLPLRGLACQFREGIYLRFIAELWSFDEGKYGKNQTGSSDGSEHQRSDA
jgi:hypothetical protein